MFPPDETPTVMPEPTPTDDNPDDEDIAPVVSITADPPSGIEVDDRFFIEWTASDDSDGVAVIEVGGAAISNDLSGRKEFTATAVGQRTFQITATNSAGSTVETVVVDIAAKTPTEIIVPVIDSHTVDSTHLDTGETTTERWQTTNADRVTIQEKVGNNPPGPEVDVALDGSRTINPVNTTEYTLRAYRGSGADRRFVIWRLTVVRRIPKPVLAFSADKTNLSEPGVVVFTYSAIPSTRRSINGRDLSRASGTFRLRIAESTNVRLYAENTVGGITRLAAKDIFITVEEEEEVVLPDPPVVSLTLRPDTYEEGGTSTLGWGIVGQGITERTLIITEGVGPAVRRTLTRNSGTIIVNPKVTTTYTLRARNAGGEDEETEVLTVTAAVPDPTASAKVDRSSIFPGQSVYATLMSTGGLSASLSPEPGPTVLNGRVRLRPTKTTTYTYTVVNVNGVKATARFTVTVAQARAPGRPVLTEQIYLRGSDRTKINWDAPADRGTHRPTSYRVFRGSTRIANNLTATIFYDNDPPPGTHIYSVEA